MNEPSASLWKKLNEVTDKLQKVSEQLIESNAINKGYHQALDQHRVKIEALERENNRTQGAISLLRWVGIFLLGLVVSGGGWTISSVNQLKQDMAIMQSHKEDEK